MRQRCVVLFSDDDAFLDAVLHAHNNGAASGSLVSAEINGALLTRRLIDFFVSRNGLLAKALPDDLPLKNGHPLPSGLGRALASVWFQVGLS